VFRAVLNRAFEIRGRGTVLAVEIRDGTIKAGDSISISTSNGTRIAQVLAVEFIDYDIGRPTFRSELGLVVDDISVTEVIVGDEVHAVSAGL